MIQNHKPLVAGLIASSAAEIGSIPLSYVNAVLQTVSLLLGISLATITLYHALRKNDWKTLDDRLKRIEGRCLNHFPEINQHKEKNKHINTNNT